MELPYNGPIDEFTRKAVRNDYPILGLWETGMRCARLPLDDLISPANRGRFTELLEMGHRFGFFTVGPPDAGDLEILRSNRDLVEFLEVILPWEKADEYLPRVLEARDELRVPVYLANIESSVHREKGGPTFSHYISHGFNVEDKAPLEEFMTRTGAQVDGYTFQVGQNKPPWRQIMDAAEYAEKKGFTALVNVRLSSENPAEYLCDEDYVANRAAESLVAAYSQPRTRVFLDTFMDLDRGYFPRHGLYDRRWNPRKGAHVLSNLKAVLEHEEGVKPVGMRAHGGCRVLELKSDGSEYMLFLPEGGARPDIAGLDLAGDAIIIDLVEGLVHTAEHPPDPRNQCLAIMGIHSSSPNRLRISLV
jgi:hypothetical protein